MNIADTKKYYIILTIIGISPYLINGYINSYIASDVYLYWFFELFTWVCIPLLVFYLAFSKLGLRANDLGLSNIIFGRKSVGLIILACIVMAPLDLFLYKTLFSFSSSILPDDGAFSYQSTMPSSGIGRLLIAIYYGLSAGIVEELYYRGLIHKVSSYYKHHNQIFIFSSSILFSLAHWENGYANILATFLFGLLLAIMYLAVKNIIPFIVGHAYTDIVWFS